MTVHFNTSKKHHFTSKLLSRVSLGVILASSASVGVNAQSFTISNGQNVTTQQIINGNNFTGTIEEGGSISVTGQFDAIRSNGDSITIKNNGTLTLNTRGLLLGQAGVAVQLNGAGNSFTNDGTINLISDPAAGTSTGAVRINGDDGTFVNNGSIQSLSDSTFAVSIRANDASFINNGYISTAGFSSVLHLTGARASIINNGTIAASDGNTSTIFIAQEQTTITNNRDIIAEGDQDAISFVDPAPFTESFGTVTNSGRIIAPLNRFAVLFGADDSRDVLNLNKGGVIQGRLDFGPGADTFNVERGISLDYTFEEVSAAGGGALFPESGVPEVVNANGATVTRIGNRVIIIDPSSVQVGPSLGAEVAGAVLDVLENRVDRTYDALEEGSVGSSNGVANPFGVWGSTFAEVAKLPSGNGFNSSTTSVAGIVIGGDVALSDSISGGILGGYAQARFDQDSGADHSSPSGFGGIYANYGDLFSMAILAGTSKGSYTREILNNTVLGGIVRNEADRNGLFIAPEITARTPKFELGGIKVQASARGRMVFEKLDGVVESANGIPVQLDDNTNQTYEGRVQLGFELIDNATTSVAVKTGLDVRSTSGFDETKFTLLGQTQQVRQSPRDNQAFGGFVGGALHHQVSDNVDVFAASEIGVMSDVNIAADFSAGIKIKF